VQMLRRRIGDFYIVEKIGSGGMAEVYLAIHPQTQEKRAIKVMRKRMTTGPAGYARFLREVELIRNLSHPNIVRVMESGVLDDCCFYSMEYARAGSLAQRMAKCRLPLEEVLDIFSSVCRGMAFAHAMGVVHRDLKPGNILIADSGEPKISDFGIAKNIERTGAALTKSNEVMGSIAYLSPEQRFCTKGVDRRTDVYSLGAILYEMVMGFPPLGKFPLPAELQPGFPEAVQGIIETCLMQRRRAFWSRRQIARSMRRRSGPASELHETGNTGRG
jgi:serine/threonine protein kinase